jgi:hypothetical protein
MVWWVFKDMENLHSGEFYAADLLQGERQKFRKEHQKIQIQPQKIEHLMLILC